MCNRKLKGACFCVCFKNKFRFCKKEQKQGVFPQRSFHISAVCYWFVLASSPCWWRNTWFNLVSVVPAKALEILSFFHSQGWSYSSGGRSSSWGSRLSLGQRRRSGSESPPFSAGSYGVSYRGSCLTDPSLGARPLDRISTNGGEWPVVNAGLLE